MSQDTSVPAYPSQDTPDLSAATPRPWKQNGSVIWGGKGETAANICAISEPRATRYVQYTELSIGSKDGDEAWANAALIVRAVNAHDELVAALRKIAALDRHSGASLRSRAASEIARAALAKAGAGQ